MSKETNIVRNGIARPFANQERVLRQWKRVHLDSAEERKFLAEYGVGKPLYTTFDSPDIPPLPVTIATAASLLRSVALDLSYQAQSAALRSEGDWVTVWRGAVAYWYWGVRMSQRWHLHALNEYQRGERKQRLSMLMLHEVGFVLSSCIALGWIELADEMARKTLKALKDELFSDAGDYGHRRAQYFVLRLIADWKGYTFPWPKFALDEPSYNYLVAHWRESAPDYLETALLAACDRHTHEARADTSVASFDFGDFDYQYYPFEILTVLRLRKIHGLSVPRLDHPLMRTPLGELPESQPLYQDALLEAVVAQARREFSDL
jgi:hypothetical protein